MSELHKPILVKEWLEFLSETPPKIYVDGTLGAGGHAEAVLESIAQIQQFIGIDQDPDALAIARERLQPWKEKTLFFHTNFSQLEEVLQKAKVEKFDAILLDLGVSSMQLDRPERGFSIRSDGPLDMRMNPTEGLSAEEVVNTWSEKELGRIFRDYGEEKQWRRAAHAIVLAREKQPIKSTYQLVEAVMPVLPRRKTGAIHPMTLIFQALRICVNSELEVIRSVLPLAVKYLTTGGMIGVISFHSLEDRIIKNFFRDEASDKQQTSGLAGLFLEKEPTLRLVTKKPVTPSDQEMLENPRSRSAKLRVAVKK